MSRLKLEFLEQDGDLSLSATHFAVDRNTVIVSRRGSYGTPQGNTFTWTSAVRAVSLLFVRFMLEDKPGEQPLLTGGTGSAAASLDYALSKQPKWLHEMFGTDTRGNVRLRRIIRRINPERKRPGPVEIYINPLHLDPKQISVVVNGREITDKNDLRMLEQRLATGIAGESIVGEAPAESKPSTPVPNRRVPEILFLFTTSLRRPYFAELLEQCHVACEAKFGSQYHPTFRAVSDGEDYQGNAAQTALLAELERLSSAVKALVVVPTLSLNLTATIAILSAARNIPVVALTLPFHESTPFLQQGLPVPPVIMSDNRAGAVALGRAMGAAFKGKGPDGKLSLFLVPGHLTRMDSLDRLQGFEAGVAECGVPLKVEIAPACEWNRDRAYSVTLERLTAAPHSLPDICFAANDLMALGIRDAIVSYNSLLSERAPRLPVVCGYDAIEEAKRLITLRDPVFFGSVEQNLALMSQRVFERLEELFALGEKWKGLAPRSEFIEPELVLNDRVSANSLSSRKIA